MLPRNRVTPMFEAPVSRRPWLDHVIGLRVTIFIMLMCAAISVVWGVAATTARHDAEHWRQVACQARLEALLIRRPELQTFWRPVNPCEALEVLD